MEKINVILDTDISNEIDDQFALTYLIKSLKNINLEAITIAPCAKSRYSSIKSIEEGVNLSLEVASKILDMIGASKYKKKMYKGASKYFFESKESNLAVERIIEIARKNENTTIIAIGAITNVALALFHAPEILNKLEIIWLGGNSFLSEKNNEFNFRQDVEAVKYVFNSKVKLTVIPCRNVASALLTTTYELEHFIGKCGEIGKYLCQIFKNFNIMYRDNKNDEIGESKVLWDMSAVAYVLNKDWFICKEISCPKILKDLSYKQTKAKHKVSFAMDINRNKIFQDFFIKMGYKKEQR